MFPRWCLIPLLVCSLWTAAVAADPVPADAAPALEVRIHRHPDVHPDFEAETRAALASRGAALRDELWPFALPPARIELHLVDTAAFRDTLRGRVADWGVGAASGRTAWVDCQRMPAVGRTVGYVALHEVAHCLLNQALGRASVPSWFHEGVAQQVSGEWRFRDTVSLIMDGGVPDLRGLEGRFPHNTHWADRAYRTSLLAVQTLRDRHGDRVIPDLVLATRQRGDFGAAFAEVTGEDDTAFADRFARSMRLRFGWLITLTRWPTLFVLMALGFALGAVLRIRRTRRRLEEMVDHEEERPDSDQEETTH